MRKKRREPEEWEPSVKPPSLFRLVLLLAGIVYLIWRLQNPS